MNTETKKCPSCKASIPLISNICFFCGKELTEISKKTSERELMSNIEKSITVIDEIKKPEVFNFVFKRVTLGFTISILITFFYLIANDCRFPIVVVIIYGILGIFTFLLAIPNKKLIVNFYKNLTYETFNFNKYKGLYALYYSDSSEINENTEIFRKKIENAKAQVKKMKKRARNILFLFFMTLNTVILFVTGGVIRFYTMPFVDTITIPMQTKNITINGDLENNMELLDTTYNLLIEKSANSSYDFYISLELKFKINKYNLTNEEGNFQNAFLTFVDKNNEEYDMVQQHSFYASGNNYSFIDKDNVTLTFWNTISSMQDLNRFIIEANRSPNMLIETRRP